MDGMQMLDNGDKAVCMQIAREIVKEVLTEHVAMCPHGKKITAFKAILIGVAIGSGAAGGGAAIALLKALVG